ncbi:pYEATS domain-containing protein [Flagellimonas flava]|uniref:YEATS family protein n=1 Tax=Flagellimonas flava TaxID=570519 RepID=A0A1M5P7W6_9FLAO|nr:pYEATS domain-containing protein [Allomuricauda flava]SHG97787.1 YEATS family protein [Allomuricauda flava]
MNKSKSLLWYFIASVVILVLLLFVQFKYPRLLQLEARWLAVAVVPIVIGIFLTERLKKFGAFGIELEAFPSQRNIGSEEEEEKLEIDVNLQDNKLPADYFFINHTSFLREYIQDEFRQKTNVELPHYDIRVIVDSYYQGALKGIKYVKYYLHQSYPEPIQIRSNMADKFCLKEIAHGEYVLIAEVYLKKTEKPIILERYITLWESGPKINK